MGGSLLCIVLCSSIVKTSICQKHLNKKILNATDAIGSNRPLKNYHPEMMLFCVGIPT